MRYWARERTLTLTINTEKKNIEAVRKIDYSYIKVCICCRVVLNSHIVLRNCTVIHSNNSVSVLLLCQVMVSTL